ncbi:DUF4192 family protein [Herbiconiux sp. VKM Ac-2851]|uniref:DUF4192 family protein n=1 Tax=Herbiconiux sp. VKM Ac-2851 TaxID=2739025 RepID=UPI0015643D02|nr:DUF4192 family protein [Herbiconiux sp. VKM Ac-2851]
MADIVGTLGFVPRGSLALRIRRRRRPFAVLRLDLPLATGADGGAEPDPAVESDAESHAVLHVADTLTTLLSRLTGVARIDLVSFAPPGGGDSPSGPPRRPRRPEVSAGSGAALVALAARLDAAGFSVGALLEVSDSSVRRLEPGSWRGDRPRRPRAGAPVPLPESLLPAERVPDAASHHLPGGDRPGCEPSGDPHRGAFVPLHRAPEELTNAALAALGLPADDHGRAEVDPMRALQLWCTALDPAGGLPTELGAIRLAWPLRRRLLRDLVLMQCAWGLDGAVTALAESLDGSDSRAGSVFSTFLGAAADAPHPEILCRSVEVLRRVAECVPPSLAASPLVMLAWLEWCRGRGTVAAAYLDECLTADPACSLAHLFRQILDQGLVPQWLD